MDSCYNIIYQFSIIISKLSIYSFTEDPVRTVLADEENNKRMKINIEEKLLFNHSVLIILLILYNFLWVLYLTFPNRLVHMTQIAMLEYFYIKNIMSKKIYVNQWMYLIFSFSDKAFQSLIHSNLVCPCLQRLFHQQHPHVLR